MTHLTGGNKYHARRSWSELAQRWFASKAECIYGESLFLMQKAGEICKLEFQKKFALCTKPKVTITIDFAYIEMGHWVYEDVKGVMTRDFRTKLC